MKIRSKWEAESSNKPSITVTGVYGGTTITIGSGRMVSVSTNSEAVDAAYEAIENMAQDMDTLTQIWEVEQAIAADLMHMVDVIPMGYRDGEWHLDCNESGLSWHLDLRPNDYTSIVVSIYLHADLNPGGDLYSNWDDNDTEDPPFGRTVSNVERSIAIEVREGIKYVATLHSMPIHNSRGPITMDIIREYLQKDLLNLSLLQTLGLELTTTTITTN